ncbi:MAG: hypothetical protein ACREQ5_37790, partial [Candidatus Dormibacteria bacterium]
QVQVARIEHWPADLGYAPDQLVVDDLLSGIRTGAFPERERELRSMSMPLAVLYQGAIKPLNFTGGTTVETIINVVRGKIGTRIGRWHVKGEEGWVRQGDGAASNDLLFDDGLWRLGKPSCFGLTTEARWLPKNNAAAAEVYENKDGYYQDPQPFDAEDHAAWQKAVFGKK